MIKVILWDLDNTILDFLLAEKNSLKAAFKKLNLGECDDETVRLYSSINIKHWEMLERGEIEKDEIFRLRFAEFLNAIGKSCDPLVLNEYYERGLCDTIAFVENAFETVSSLNDKYYQYCVTNGRADVQKNRLRLSGLDKIFKGVFISDEIGFEKPDKKFFDAVFKGIIPCKKEEVLIIGDSLTSDMLGGNNAKIKCCWYNPGGKQKPNDVRIDYEIKAIEKIRTIL